jgi:hypothetical protein
MVEGVDDIVEGSIPLEALWLACRPGDAPYGILSLFPSSGLATIRAVFPSVPLSVVFFDGTGNDAYERAFGTALSILQGDVPIPVLRVEVGLG